MKKSRIFAILLCIALLVGVAACGGNTNNGGGASSSPSTGGSSPSASGSSPSADGASSPSTGGSQPSDGGAAVAGDDTLTVAIRVDPSTLNWAALGGDSAALLQLIMEPMWTVQMLPEGGHEIIYWLAKDVEVIEENGKYHWIIHLRDDVTFSNGNKFTASDVIFTIKQAREVGIFGISRTQEIDIENTKILDDYTIEMHFTGYRFNQMEIYSDLLIYDEESFDLEGAANDPIGTGPYLLTDRLINSHLFMERRDDYWGEAPGIKSFQFRVM